MHYYLLLKSAFAYLYARESTEDDYFALLKDKLGVEKEQLEAYIRAEMVKLGRRRAC
ncbi:MAG: hypothetical protein AAF798_01440 [Bacteroidota bacterium]